MILSCYFQFTSWSMLMNCTRTTLTSSDINISDSLVRNNVADSPCTSEIPNSTKIGIVRSKEIAPLLGNRESHLKKASGGTSALRHRSYPIDHIPLPIATESFNSHEKSLPHTFKPGTILTKSYGREQYKLAVQCIGFFALGAFSRLLKAENDGDGQIET